MNKIQNNRWAITDDNFAARLEFPDLEGSFEPRGFFQRLANRFGSETLVIEPGTRAWFVANGNVVGSLEPGQVTIQSCLEKFKIWQVKQATIVLCRAEDQVFSFELNSIPTREGVLIDIDITMTIQMDPNGIGWFAESFLGTKPELSREELKARFQPLLMQSIKQAISTIPSNELVGGQAAETISSMVVDQLALRLRRYGFKFVQTEVANLKSEQLLKRFQTQQNLWEKEQQINDNVRRLDIKSKLREQHLSDAINQIETKEEYEKFLDSVDTDQILRREDKDKLIFEFDNNREDRESLREHMVAVLDRERDFELESLNSDYEHQLNVKSIDQEIEIASLSNNKSSQQLIAELEQQKLQEDAYRAKQRDDWDHWRNKQTVKRDDDWDSLLHARRKEDIETELAVQAAERKTRVALIEHELASRLENDQFEREKRRKAWELDVEKQDSDNQLDRLKQVQQMNADFEERQLRLKSEIEELKEDKSSERRLALVNSLRGATTEELVALADSDNAATLAQMKSNEALTEVKLQAADQLTQAANDKSEAVAEALKEAMRTQQSVLNAVTGSTPQAQPAAAPSTPPPPPTAVANTKWFLARNGETHGPYSEEQMKSFIQSGNVSQADQICQEGTTQWLTLSSVPQFNPTLSGGSTPPPPPPPVS